MHIDGNHKSRGLIELDTDQFPIQIKWGLRHMDEWTEITYHMVRGIPVYTCTEYRHGRFDVYVEIYQNGRWHGLTESGADL